jgi:hypothetical protein
VSAEAIETSNVSLSMATVTETETETETEIGTGTETETGRGTGIETETETETETGRGTWIENGAHCVGVASGWQGIGSCSCSCSDSDPDRDSGCAMTSGDGRRRCLVGGGRHETATLHHERSCSSLGGRSCHDVVSRWDSQSAGHASLVALIDWT